MPGTTRGISKNPLKRAHELIREFRATARTLKQKGDNAAALRALSEAAAIEKDLALREHRDRPEISGAKEAAGGEIICASCGAGLPSTVRFTFRIIEDTVGARRPAEDGRKLLPAAPPPVNWTVFVEMMRAAWAEDRRRVLTVMMALEGLERFEFSERKEANETDSESVPRSPISENEGTEGQGG